MRASLLALALLIAPAFAKDDQQLTASQVKPYCVTSIVQALKATLAFRSCPEMVNFLRVRELARQARLTKPCERKRRVRSPVDGKCYFPERLP